MYILFCGAIDLRQVSDQFAEVVNGFGAQKMHFLDASIDYSTYNDWKTNSENSVAMADIVVYVLLENYGEITWKTEYITATKLGKPFIVMVLEQTHNSFFEVHSGKLKLKSKKTKEGKVFEVLETLLLENVTWVTFTFGSFKEKLKTHLGKIFDHGIHALTEKNNKQVLISLAKTKNFKSLKESIDRNNNKQYLLDILFDIFENKELRKRIIDYFIEYKGLTDEQLVDLITDGEQGVSRKAIKNLPDLVTSENKLDVIFPALLEATEESEDTGTLRRAIVSFMEINIEAAIPYLKSLFPADDIGTPRRILKYINTNFKAISADKNFRRFKNDLKQLIDTAKTYSKDAGTLKELAAEIEKKWDKL